MLGVPREALLCSEQAGVGWRRVTHWGCVEGHSRHCSALSTLMRSCLAGLTLNACTSRGIRSGRMDLALGVGEVGSPMLSPVGGSATRAWWGVCVSGCGEGNAKKWGF